jgi:hypothetical protein
MKFKFLSLWLVISSLIAVPSMAQMNNPDDLPNDPAQMKTWYCSEGNQGVLVEVKLVNNWQKIIAQDSWQCMEKLVNIPANAPQFTCESDENQINFLTVIWLEGNQAKTQMKSWIDAFQQQNMICTVDQTNPFWQ